MKQILLSLVYGAIGLIVGAATIFILQVRSRPDLSLWHLADLDKEFTAADAGRITDLKAYRQLEDVLFRQLETVVYDQVPATAEQSLNRYRRNSWSDPHGFDINWNRTFEWKAARPRAGVLLLHGLSDGPYSLHSLGRSLHRADAWVVGLRLPGHGTIPTGLARVQWQDFTAAVRLAARDLAAKIGADRPLYLMGYSNGAALALEYTLAQMSGEALPRPAGLVLISPAISVTSMAALARWNVRLSRIPGLEKLAWLSIKPEYDPYKYNSFAVNAGHQIYELTNEVAARLRVLVKEGKLDKFPPILAFQSVVDATIPPGAVVDNLLIHMPAGRHRLVLFDLNRRAEITTLLGKDPLPYVEKLLNSTAPFDVDLVTNRTPHSTEVLVQRKPARLEEIQAEIIGLAWPQGIYSLSHVALPFSSRDPVYGIGSASAKSDVSLGSLEPRGEKDLLNVAIEDLMRLRYNPFYNYMESQILEWMLPASK